MKNENAQFTPGPWRAIAWGQTISIDSNMVTGIARINPWGNHNAGIPFANDTANARLIAAAPDLLLTLEMLAEEIQDGYLPADKAQKMRAAIAKAKGE